MNITLNKTEISIEADGCSLAQLLRSRGITPTGIAVAINDRVVRKADWDTTRLSDGDRITVITAVCGG